MKKFYLFPVLFLSVATFAQEKIPDVYSVKSQFERIEIIRMRNGTDLLAGLKKIVTEKNIKNAVILSGIGSVTNYQFHVVGDKNLPPAEKYHLDSVAMDLIAVQGYIFNGRVHAHISLSDENKVVGGHLEPGTKALTFIIITLGVLSDTLKLENFDNYKW